MPKSVVEKFSLKCMIDLVFLKSENRSASPMLTPVFTRKPQTK